jgi:hypothetical protein
MLGRIRARLTYANVVATLALFIAVSTGGAYAANTIGSADVIDNSLLSQDIKDGEVKAADIGTGQVVGSRIADETIKSADIADGRVAGVDIATNAITTGKIADGNVFTNDIADGSVSNPKVTDGAITSAKVLDGSQIGGGLNSEDINPLNGDVDILDNTITTFDLATNSVDSDEIVDFGLSNQDIGVLTAQINADGTVFSSSGGVTSVHVGTGTYDVDFGRDISNCTFNATQGEGGVGGAAGAILGVTDRAGNAEAVFVTVRTDANASVDRAFQLIVVC